MLSAEGLPTPLIVTHSGIRTSSRSTGRFRPASPRRGTLSYHLQSKSATAARRLSPRHFRRGMARPVSYYALLKWWLLLSQHPGCHRDPTSFATERRLGALVGGLGCFPLEREAYPPRSDSRGNRSGLRSWVWPGRREAPQTNSVALRPERSDSRLALKPFRRERAISRFDKTFTPPHRSSPSFSTLVGSVLHGLLRPLQPAHG